MISDDPCRHCKTRLGRWYRGLCHPCYHLLTPCQRRHYPALHPGKPGVTRGSYRMPAEPTDALPGSEEKIRVLIARAERGEALFHPEDATMMDRHPTAAAEVLARLMPQEGEEVEDGTQEADEVRGPAGPEDALRLL